MHEGSREERLAANRPILELDAGTLDIRWSSGSLTTQGGLIRERSSRLDIEFTQTMGEDERGATVGSVRLFHGALSASFGGQLEALGIQGLSGSFSGIGIGAAWTGQSGLYVDLRGSIHRFNVNLTGGHPFAATGASASVEVGQTMPMPGGWTVTPSMQLGHAYVRTPAVHHLGRDLAGGATSSWLARAGVHAQRDIRTEAGAGAVWGSLNGFHETGPRGTARGSFIEVGIGGSYTADASNLTVSGGLFAPVTGPGRGRDIRAAVNLSMRF